MTKSKAALGIGNVEIDLDGETVTLRPTLQAAQAISRLSGGISGAVRAVGQFDIDTIASVVSLGLGVSGKDAKDIPDRVFNTGLADLIGPVSTYLTILANGGRPVTSGGEEDEDPRKGE